MFNLLKSDFYKLFRSASFYVCAIIAAVLAYLTGSLLQYLYIVSSGFDISLALQFISPVQLFKGGFESAISFTLILCAVLVSVFISKDFSTGIIKNTLSRGHNRILYYFSKFLTCFSACVMYIVLCALVVFIGNGISFGFGEITKQMYGEILTAIGMTIIYITPIISFTTMLAFLIRSTAGSITVAICTVGTGITSTLLQLIDYFVTDVFKWSETFSSANYWLTGHLGNFIYMSIKDPSVTRGLIVCGSWLLISLVIGIASFYKRDIK